MKLLRGPQKVNGPVSRDTAQFYLDTRIGKPQQTIYVIFAQRYGWCGMIDGIIRVHIADIQTCDFEPQTTGLQEVINTFKENDTLLFQKRCIDMFL